MNIDTAVTSIEVTFSFFFNSLGLNSCKAVKLLTAWYIRVLLQGFTCKGATFHNRMLSRQD